MLKLFDTGVNGAAQGMILVKLSATETLHKAGK